MYEKAQSEEPSDPAGTGSADATAEADPGGGEVIDAEYVDVDEQAS